MMIDFNHAWHGCVCKHGPDNFGILCINSFQLGSLRQLYANLDSPKPPNLAKTLVAQNTRLILENF